MGGGDHCAVYGCDNDRRFPERQVKLPRVGVLSGSIPREKRKRWPLGKRISKGPGSNQESEWAEWGNDEHFSIKIEPSNPPPLSEQTDNNAGADDLFKDMTPVFKKAKKIVIKSKQTDSDHQANNSPSRLNFDMNFPPTQTDLVSWEDTSGGWEENEMSAREIEWETENVIKEKKQAERERRAIEQQRRKEEREVVRLAKKNQQHLGVKVNA